MALGHYGPSEGAIAVAESPTFQDIRRQCFRFYFSFHVRLFIKVLKLLWIRITGIPSQAETGINFMQIRKFYPNSATPDELLWTLSSFEFENWEKGQIDIQSEEPYAVRKLRNQ